ncbi:hypothetical protein JCM5350_006299 [Sporobolomyces pararoseus]
MPVPSLPLDVVSVILSNFHATPASNEDALEAASAVGKAVSLVCRAWSPLGQALLWRQLKIDLLQTSSLLLHLRSLPHLSPLVQQLDIEDLSGDSRSNGNDQEEEEESREDSAIIELITKLSNLRNLKIESRWSNLDEIIVTCSKLPSLESVSLNGQTLSVSAQVESAFNEGFPVLRSLSLLPVEIVIEDEEAQQGLEKEEDPSFSSMRSEEETEIEKDARKLEELELVVGRADRSTCIRFAKKLESRLGWSHLERCFVGESGPYRKTLADSSFFLLV